MTTSVNQAGTIPDWAKADAPRHKGKGGEAGFADAMKSGTAGKQARHTAVVDASGETRRPRWNVEFNIPAKATGERLAAEASAGARHRWELPVGLPDISTDGGAADGLDDPKTESAEDKAAPDSGTVAETVPIAFRTLLPPMILLGGFGRPEAGTSSNADSSKSAAEADIASPSEPDKKSPVLAKTDMAATVPAAATAMLAQANAKTAPGKAAALEQSATAQAANAAAKEGEPKPMPTTGEPAANTSAGSLRGDTATGTVGPGKPMAAESASRPDGVATPAKIARDSSHENTLDAPNLAGRVIVLAQQSIPAPATPFPGLTAAPLLAAIATDGSWRELAAAADSRGLPAQNTAASTHSLKVQLHPAELGMVTASLRFSGEQLTIELQVETAEAQQRLSADSDTIIKSLRALGLEVDRVTIQQSTVVQTPSARADANAGQNGQPAPDRQSFNASGGNGQAGSQHSGRNTSNDAQASQNTAPGSPDPAGGGLYI
jgi:chemotaxis protein MotD